MSLNTDRREAYYSQDNVMAFSDPQSVTINAVANSLPRTGQGPSSGTFTKDDGTVKLNILQNAGKRFRRSVRIDHQKYAADPYDVTLLNNVSMSAYLVVDVPKQGYTIAEQKQIVDALTKYLTDSSGARVTQLLGAEI
jgi:hypothetical protein